MTTYSFPLNELQLTQIQSTMPGFTLKSTPEFKTMLQDPMLLVRFTNVQQLKALIKSLRVFLPRNRFLATLSGRKQQLANRCVDAIRIEMGLEPAFENINNSRRTHHSHSSSNNNNNPSTHYSRPLVRYPQSMPALGQLPLHPEEQARQRHIQTMRNMMSRDLPPQFSIHNQDNLEAILGNLFPFNVMNNVNNSNMIKKSDNFKNKKKPLPKFEDVVKSIEYLNGRSPVHKLQDAVVHKEVTGPIKVGIKFSLPSQKFNFIRQQKSHALHLRLFDTDKNCHVRFDENWLIDVNNIRVKIEKKSKKVGFKKQAKHIVKPLDLSEFVVCKCNAVNANYLLRQYSDFRGYLVMEYVELLSNKTLVEKVLSGDNILPVCSYCSKSFRNKPIKCEYCYKISYCSEEHRDKDKGNHLNHCTQAAMLSYDNNNDNNNLNGEYDNNNNNDKGDSKDKVNKNEVNDKNNMDDDIAMVDCNIQLLCPLSLERIEIPAKGKKCSHPQCFDLLTYLENCVHCNVWQCPLCHKSLEYEELIVDQQMLEILKRTSNDVTQVKLHHTGTFKIIEENVENESDDGEGYTNTANKEIVELDITEDVAKNAAIDASNAIRRNNVFLQPPIVTNPSKTKDDIPNQHSTIPTINSIPTTNSIPTSTSAPLNPLKTPSQSGITKQNDNDTNKFLSSPITNAVDNSTMNAATNSGELSFTAVDHHRLTSDNNKSASSHHQNTSKEPRISGNKHILMKNNDNTSTSLPQRKRLKRAHLFNDNHSNSNIDSEDNVSQLTFEPSTSLINPFANDEEDSSEKDDNCLFFSTDTSDSDSDQLIRKRMSYPMSMTTPVNGNQSNSRILVSTNVKTPRGTSMNNPIVLD